MGPDNYIFFSSLFKIFLSLLRPSLFGLKSTGNIIVRI